MTVGEELIILDESGGNVLARHLVDATTEDVEFLPNCRWVKGVYIDTFPADTGGGTAKVVAQWL